MGEGHLQGTGGKAGLEVILHSPADDLAAIKVHDAGEVEEPFGRGQVSDITDPDLIDGCGRRSLGEPVRRDGLIMIAIGGADPKSLAAACGQALLTHEPFDAFVIAEMTALLEFVREPRAAIGAFEAFKSAFNEKLKVTILLATRAGGSFEPGIISAAREAQSGAKIGNGIKWRKLFHSLAALGGWERMARVFFKISH